MKTKEQMCIVHVDDNRADAVAVRRLLIQITPEAKIHSLESAEALFDFLARPEQAEQVDIILLDLSMPRISGHEVIAELKSHSKLARLPVVVLSSSSAAADQSLAYEQGANAYLTKSSDLDSYRHRLSAALAIWCGPEQSPVSHVTIGKQPVSTGVKASMGEMSLHALVVDDAEGDAHLLRRYLERLEGWRIQCDLAATPAEASAKLEARQYDLIILDYHLGNGTGLDVLEQCRHPMSNAGTILLTGVGDERIAAEAIRAGVDDYMTKKELGSSALEASIGRVLERAQRRSGLHLDRLTGLHNRNAMQERLVEELNRCQRYGGHFSLMLIDLDRFKPINDKYGHPVGDDLLKQVCDLIRETLREVDFPARYGGDEFCIITPDATAEEARQLARRLQEQLKKTVFYCGDQKHPLQAGCSVGILECGGGKKMDAATALSLVDRAMYRAKEDGDKGIEVVD